MRAFILTVLCFFALKADAVMLDADGLPRVEPHTVYEVNDQCRMHGYFLLNDTLFMCAVVREGVTKEEYRAEEKASGERAVQRMFGRFK